MSTTHQVRLWWKEFRCVPGPYIQLWNKSFVRLRGEAHEAGHALEAILDATGYGVPDVVGSHRYCPTGISGRRCESSGRNCSLHNYSLALDIDPFGKGNPYFRKRFGGGWDFDDCKFTRAQIETVEDLRTVSGAQVWKWLGWAIGDTMHFEITCSPADLATGVVGMPPPVVEFKDMFCQHKTEAGPYPSSGDVVTYWQHRLLAIDKDALPGWGADGDYGDETANAVGELIPPSNGQQIGPFEAAYLDSKYVPKPMFKPQVTKKQITIVTDVS